MRKTIKSIWFQQLEIIWRLYQGSSFLYTLNWRLVLLYLGKIVLLDPECSFGRDAHGAVIEEGDICLVSQFSQINVAINGDNSARLPSNQAFTIRTNLFCIYTNFNFYFKILLCNLDWKHRKTVCLCHWLLISRSLRVRHFFCYGLQFCVIILVVNIPGLH